MEMRGIDAHVSLIDSRRRKSFAYSDPKSSGSNGANQKEDDCSSMTSNVVGLHEPRLALANQPRPTCQEKFDMVWNDEVQDFVRMDAMRIGTHESYRSEVNKEGYHFRLPSSFPAFNTEDGADVTQVRPASTLAPDHTEGHTMSFEKWENPVVGTKVVFHKCDQSWRIPDMSSRRTRISQTPSPSKKRKLLCDDNTKFEPEQETPKANGLLVRRELLDQKITAVPRSPAAIHC
ncbi:hypothetical protein HO133_004970 [Letharia lupina]|uniref:Uncharacterized protein n=1 Tax=Letharia lupina TaxID=560253 RepID=A0A8H6C936_9LECA|nr:uncharacterized protein HO133_004970 [Letharia lupina]KAF6219145.1 hypothetical protein HO133_004970 [Letharia lupina]